MLATASFDCALRVNAEAARITQDGANLCESLSTRAPSFEPYPGFGGLDGSIDIHPQGNLHPGIFFGARFAPIGEPQLERRQRNIEQEPALLCFGGIQI